MPLSRAKNRERMRALRASEKESGTVILPKRVVKALKAVGVDPGRYKLSPDVTLAAYRDLERTLAAKVARVEWQSGGIKVLHDDVATLKATLETLTAHLQTSESQRITQLEANQALHEAAAHYSMQGAE